MQQLIELYTSTYECIPAEVVPLAKAGSNRKYYRMTAPADAGSSCPPSVIGVIGADRSENNSFVYLARHFERIGLPVPSIHAISEDGIRYLQSDLGNRSLYDAVANGRRAGGDYSPEEVELLRRTIRLLPHIQTEGAEGLDFHKLLPPVSFDERAAKFDLNYFKYCFLKTTDIPYDEVALEDDFERFAHDLVACSSPTATFLYRDFQGRNVMLDAAGQPHLIDFQGGQRGPIFYDVASFLWQASARYPDSLRETLIADYLDELGSIPSARSLADPVTFRRHLSLFVLFRLLQVLGAYGLRGYVERKQYFINSIPHAIASLAKVISEGASAAYPTLQNALQRLVALPRFAVPVPVEMTAEFAHREAERKHAPLVVRVFSFSYKRGIPEDTSGNGGGYVFDCRSTHNPGRYEPYKQLTGLDAPVIKFLEDDGEILTFLESVYALADAHCQRYIQRGFSDLMFSFGCTGGQHRSVYSAQHLAEHLNRKFGIEVRLVHREQHIEQTFPAR